MSNVKTVNKKVKFFIIILGFFLLLVVLLFSLFFTTWLKGRLIAQVEEHSNYKLKINSITLKGLHGLQFKGIELSPKLDSTQFYHSGNKECDWVVVKATIFLVGIDWRNLLWENIIYADKLTITETDLYVFRNKKMPDAPYKYKPLHSRLLRNASFSITIPLIQIVKASIAYEENSDAGVRSKIVFSKLYGTIYHLSTDSAYIAGQPEVIVEGKGIIADSIEGAMRYKFNTLNKRDSYTFEGHTGAFSASILNKYITPMTGAQISSGHVGKIALLFHADDNLATGTLDIDYNNLRVDFLSKKNRGLKLILKTLINKDDRKRNGKEMKVGKINCKRDAGKSVFNYWWHAIKSGLQSSIVKIELPEKRKK